MSLEIITSRRKRRKFLTYDLEWIPGTLQVRVVGVYDGNSYRCYQSIPAFLRGELTSDNRGKWFFAHAGGLADVQFVLAEVIQSQKYTVKASFSGSSAIICNLSHGKNNYHFIDSYWLLRDSLENIGRAIGRNKTGPKVESEGNQALIKEWYANAPLSELIPYNENDCVILWEAIDRFQDAIFEMGGQLQPTIASCAMHLFRRQYLQERISTGQQVNRETREAYFASRVEVFSKDCDDAYYYDINSSFPHAMTKGAPGNLVALSTSISDRCLWDPVRYPYFADVTIDTGELYLPPTPTRVKGRVFFPTGRWRSWLSGVDIALLLREGGSIERVHEVKEYGIAFDLRDYAQDLYAKRNESKDPYHRIVYKYLLNSLYGKFAEADEKQAMHINPRESVLDRLSWEDLLMPGVWLEKLLVPVPHMHVPISAHLTAMARQTLYDYMCLSDDFHYCDTDGFSTTTVYETGDKLGELKLEKLIKKGLFVLPKVYRLDGSVLGSRGEWEDKTLVKAKGFSLGKGPSAVQKWESLANGQHVEIERMIRIRENFRYGYHYPREATIKKRLQSEAIPKRFFYPDGHSRPWSIRELESIT